MSQFTKPFFKEVWAKLKSDMGDVWWVFWRMMLIIIALSTVLFSMDIDPTQGYWMNGFIFVLTLAMFFYRITHRDKP